MTDTPEIQSRPDRPPPKRFKIGHSADFMQVSEVADILGVTQASVRALCAGFEDPIPIIRLPSQAEWYILTYALETALFSAGMPKKILGQGDLLRVHQELAALTYGAASKADQIRRAEFLVKTLTRARKTAKMSEKAPHRRYRPDKGNIGAWTNASGTMPTDTEKGDQVEEEKTSGLCD